MTENSKNTTVVRTERGLTVHGTRLTLYLLMDCIKGGWTADQIKECYALTDKEYIDVITYIAAHGAEFELICLVLERAVEIPGLPG